jgi:HK97 gp10 family phage protein
MITLNANNLDKTIKLFEKLTDDLKPDVQLALNAFGINVERDAKANVSSHSDTGALMNSIQWDQGDLSVSVGARAEYAAFVEFGTRKFATQYVATLPQDWQAYAATFKGKKTGNFDSFIKKLIQWGKSRGIDEDGAYKLARKILRDGTKAKPFLYPAVNKNLPIFIEDIKDIFK